ncbi:MAG TPA: Uma2 family endonuclease [Chloroflexia bacterium]|nr:Uma2 family endonuclease [Chloroflexia bacterium]
MKIKTEATIEDLYHIPGKAELVNGEIVLMPPTGGDSGSAGDAIASSLRAYAKQRGLGTGVGDNKGFVVDLPHRKLFSPDAAYHLGERTPRFYQGAPIFAVQVRSENDYGPAAERDIAQKRADYFVAGTQVVWDVDVLREGVVRVYRASDPSNPTIYRRGDIAEGEPAVPGWTVSVDDLFD